MSKTIKKEKMVKNSNQSQQLPFDVQNNIKLLEKQIGSDNESLMEWVKKQPDFKGVIPFKFTPIVENQKQYDSYNFEIDDNIYYIQERKLKEIPLVNLEITTDKDCNINSLTMIITKKGKPYKVISQKDYGIIKSRYLLDSNGKIKNYDKCDLIPFDGEYKEYRRNNKSWGRDSRELNKVFNYKNGVKHGICKTYYKGEYPYTNIGSFNQGNNEKKYWYEMFTYVNGTKEGLYENTKNLERGNLKNGKRVGEWIVKLSDDFWIPNFSSFNRKNIEQTETHRVKCNYMDYKLEGKWEGITIKEFFGINDEKKIGFVGGEFKNGVMDGEFSSEFWNGKYNILRGRYENNNMIGEWYGKSSEITPITRYSMNKEIKQNLKKGKLWYSWKEGNVEEYLSSDEVKDYCIEISLYNGKYSKMRGIVNHKKENYKNNELISVRIDNSEDMNYNIELEKGIKPFNEYTKDWIPYGYKNKGLSIVSYGGRKDGKLENEVIHFHIRKNNIFGYHGLFDDNTLSKFLEYGYPYSHKGRDGRDLRKKKTYPTLPSNNDDFYKMGEYYSSDYQYGEKELTLISIDGEIFEQNRFEKNTDEYKSKRNEITKKVVKLLSEERKKELSEIKKEESKDFTLFPMD